MSIAGIASTALFSLLNNQQSTQNKNPQGIFQQIQDEFQQLGQDLQAGNLSQAQQDYAMLSQNFPQANPSGGATSNNPIAQAFSALSQDPHSGNLAAAQQDYSTIQQDLQRQNSGGIHGPHHLHGGGLQQQQIEQAFSSLSSALQSGNVTAAQNVFAALDLDLGSFDSTTVSASLIGGLSSGPSQSNGNFSVVA